MNKSKKMTREQLLKLCFSGMFAALICVATMVIQIPAPLAGYVHFGDCFILIAAWVLGPWYGFAAGGIGSALADLLTGYAHYVPGTLIIKGLMAVAAALIFHALASKSDKHRLPGFIVSGLAAELIMVAGYYLYKATFLQRGWIATLANIPSNCVQGAFGLVFGVVLIQIIVKTGLPKKFPVYSAR